MDGKQLKDILYTTRIQQTEIARRLGMSQQSFNQALNVKDIKTGLLEKLCDALGVKMSFFYPDDYDKPTTIVNANRANGAAIATGSGSATAGASNDKETIKALLEQNQQLINILKDKI